MFSIAIDGPAGSGKSTVAREVAKVLTDNYIETIYVDTGAIYRAIAYFLLNNYKDDEILSEAFIKEVISNARIELSYADKEQRVFLCGEDITSRLRTQEVSELTSKIAGFFCVRDYLIRLQKDIATKYNVVMDGRDIGTCILPSATLKIFLIASANIRADRRFLELKNKGEKPVYEDIREEILARDNRDMTRSIAPLVQAEDAIRLDTSLLTIEEVRNNIIELFKEKINV